MFWDHEWSALVWDITCFDKDHLEWGEMVLAGKVEVVHLLLESIQNLGVPRHVRRQYQDDHILGISEKYWNILSLVIYLPFTNLAPSNIWLQATSLSRIICQNKKKHIICIALRLDRGKVLWQTKQFFTRKVFELSFGNFCKFFEKEFACSTTSYVFYYEDVKWGAWMHTNWHVSFSYHLCWQITIGLILVTNAKC